MKLAIISHTEHYINKNGTVVGWGPTVREINHLAAHFDKIYHVACLHKGIPPPSSLGYIGDNFEFIALPPSGGNTVRAKLSVLRTLPAVIRTVNSIISKVDYFQLRLPTGMGNYLLPWILFKKPKARFWVKYAGNWAQKKPPPGYAFQRWFLKKNFLKCKVTINGQWPDQPEHILSFENPCLTNQDRSDGLSTIKVKSFENKLDFVFVGHIVETKGVKRIIEAFGKLGKHSRIGLLHFVGDGPVRSEYENLARRVDIECRFYGFLSREDVNRVLTQANIILLPSDSEGFPKVIAEGANYGCIPVVTDISCLSQYVHDSINGFLMDSPSTDELLKVVKKIIVMNGSALADIALNAYRIGDRFTYDYYNNRIKKDILNQDYYRLNA